MDKIDMIATTKGGGGGGKKGKEVHEVKEA